MWPRRWPLTLTAALLAVVLAAGVVGSNDRASAAPTSCRYSGGGPPFATQSYEADRARQTYLDALLLAARNDLFPNDPDFALPELLVGLPAQADAAAVIPAEILFAIAWIESNLTQPAREVPYGAIGPTLLSFDCGYGIMQVTSSIVNDGGLPSRYEALVATHFAYNIAAGARILAEKWNTELFPIVGERDPRYVESWYYAIWAYNGFASVNHPSDSQQSSGRGTYDCRGSRNGYPYQELVLGCLINPPIVDGQALWSSLAIELPDLSELARDGGPLDIAHFYASWDDIYAPIAGATSPFAKMNLDLPAGVAIASPATSPGSQLRERILGQPVLRPWAEALELTSSQLSSGDVPLEIHNDGSGLLVWRIVEAPSWLATDITAGVALGTGYEFSPTPQPSRILLSASADGVPEGTHRGQLTLAVEHPDGVTQTQRIGISLNKRGAAFYEAGNPQS